MSGVKFASFQDELFQLKYKDEDGGQIEGYGSVFNVIDEGGDIVVQGAYANVIEQFLVTGFTGDSHKWGFGDSIGYPVSAYEDDYGLYIVRQFYKTPDAQNIRQKVSERIAAKKSVGLSVGFIAQKVLTIYRANYAAELPKYIRPELLESQLLKAQSFPMIRVIQEVKYLFEDSIVCSPMNRMALASKVKSHPFLAELEEEEQVGEDSNEIKEEGVEIPAPTVAEIVTTTGEETADGLAADALSTAAPESGTEPPTTTITPPTTVKTNSTPNSVGSDIDSIKTATDISTSITPLTVQPDFKGGMFGDYIGDSLTFSTINRLTEIMLWALIYEAVFAKSLPKAEKLELLGQIIAEYAQHVMNISAALLTEDGDTKSLSEEAQLERKQIEAGITNPFFTKARDFLKTGSPLAGLTFQEHSQLTLAVSKEYSNRLADIVLTRLKEGRKISTNTLNRMRAWYDVLVEMTGDLGDLIEEVDPSTEKGATPQEIIPKDNLQKDAPSQDAPPQEPSPQEPSPQEPSPQETSPTIESDAEAKEETTSDSDPAEPPIADTPEVHSETPEPEQPDLTEAKQRALEELRVKALRQRAFLNRDALHPVKVV